MNIAFDGNVFTGKTTFIKKIAGLGNFNIIKEYPYFVNKINPDIVLPSKFLEHYKYLLADSLRLAQLRAGDNLLDRCFVSLSAHIYALNKIGQIDFRSEHLFVLEKLFKQKKIIIPDFYIFVTCGYSGAKKRFLADKRLVRTKRTPPIFIRRDYYAAIDEFNQLWQKDIIKNNGLIIKNVGGTKINIDKMIANIKKKKCALLSAKRIVKIIKSIFYINNKKYDNRH